MGARQLAGSLCAHYHVCGSHLRATGGMLSVPLYLHLLRLRTLQPFHLLSCPKRHLKAIQIDIVMSTNLPPAHRVSSHERPLLKELHSDQPPSRLAMATTRQRDFYMPSNIKVA